MEFNIGDAVVIHKPENTHEFPIWNDDMDKFDGMRSTVRMTSGDCIKVHDCPYWFSRYWLEYLQENEEEIEAVDICQILY